MHLITALMVIACIALTSGCSAEKSKLQTLNSDAVILAFGDSLTYGTGTTPEHSYPAVLQRLTGRKVINAGIPGELSGDGANRLVGLLEGEAPDLLILCHGANDLLRKMNKENMADNIRSMIRLARSKGVDVVLISVPTPRLVFRKPEPVYKTIAEEFNLPYEEDIIARLESEPGLKSDAIHFNAKGYKQFAEAINVVLKANGAL